MAVKKKEANPVEWEVGRVVTVNNPGVNAYGKDWPVGTELGVVDVRELVCEVRFPGGYIGTLPRAYLDLTDKFDVNFNVVDRPVPTSEPAVAIDRPQLSKKERALERKRQAIAIGESAARIMEQQREGREAAAASNGSKRVRKPKAVKVTSDAVPLKRICTDLDIEPRVARRLLRGAKKEPLAQVDGRWEWPKAQVPEVSALLKRLADEQCRD